jgi:hypothetical protein
MTITAGFPEYGDTRARVGPASPGPDGRLSARTARAALGLKTDKSPYSFARPGAWKRGLRPLRSGVGGYRSRKKRMLPAVPEGLWPRVAPPEARQSRGHEQRGGHEHDAEGVMGRSVVEQPRHQEAPGGGERQPERRAGALAGALARSRCAFLPRR